MVTKPTVGQSAWGGPLNDALDELQATADGKQPLDSDLTTIAGLTPTTDNVIQSVAGAWASRTMAQLKTALALVKGDVGLGNADNTADAAKPISTAVQTALDLKAARFRSYIAGRYYSAAEPYIPNIGAWPDGNQSCIPFWVSASFTADRISIEVTTLNAATSIRLGIYNNATNDLPGTVLLDAGTVSAATTGVKEITISQALTPGLYWLAAAPQGGTGTIRCVGTATQPPVAATTFAGSAATVGMNCYYQTGISGAFATWPGSPVAGNPGPLVKLRAA